MRELFKAKRSDNGDWVEGLLTIMMRQYHIINLQDENTAYPINRNTICQHTGIESYSAPFKHKPVWEYDTLAINMKEHPNFEEKQVVATVRYKRGMFILESEEFTNSYIPLSDIVQVGDCEWIDAEVVGNFFDSQE